MAVSIYNGSAAVSGADGGRELDVVLAALGAERGYDPACHGASQAQGRADDQNGITHGRLCCCGDEGGELRGDTNEGKIARLVHLGDSSVVSAVLLTYLHPSSAAHPQVGHHMEVGDQSRACSIAGEDETRSQTLRRLDRKDRRLHLAGDVSWVPLSLGLRL